MITSEFFPGKVATKPAIGREGYFTKIGWSSTAVFFGQSFLSVLRALRNAEWLGQLGSADICGMVRAMMALAIAAFFSSKRRPLPRSLGRIPRPASNHYAQLPTPTR
jgi:hypothetical protein